jgi:dihydroorotase
VRDTQVLREALTYAATHGLAVLLPAQDPFLSAGCAHEGAVATRLGLSAIPDSAETTELARLIALARDTGARVHAGPLSSAAGVAMLRQAHRDGVNLSAHTTSHHLHLSEAAIDGFDSRAHVVPPLRAAADRDALRGAVADGTIEAVTADHQPHEGDAKRMPFGETAAGITGIETLLSLMAELVARDVCDWPSALARVTAGPARALGLAAGGLSVDAPADVCVFDPRAHWQVEPEQLRSQGHNTPFAQWTLPARVESVRLAGRAFAPGPS